MTSNRKAATSERLTRPSTRRVAGSMMNSRRTPGTDSRSTTDLQYALF